MKEWQIKDNQWSIDGYSSYFWIQKRVFFRHTGSGKRFALAMNIREDKIWRGGDKQIDVVNLKCAPEVIETNRSKVGLARRWTLKFIVARLAKQASL